MSRTLASRPGARALAAGLLAVVAAACGGSDGPRAEIEGIASLDGRSIAVASLGNTAALEVRYVLQEGYGLSAGRDGSAVTLVEATADALPDLLRDGEVDAIVLSQASAYQTMQRDDTAVLAHVTQEMRDLTGAPVLNSVLVTYADVANDRHASLLELNRMLIESMTYFDANKATVIDEVATEGALDPEFLRWWWERYDVAFGARGADLQAQLAAYWGSALALGDIDAAPDARASVVPADPPATEPPSQAGVKTTVSLAVLGDAGRRAALYAIDQGLITSDLIDLDVAYLDQAALTEAASTKQYTAIEATPLIVPQGTASGVEFRVLSSGLLSLDGTLLFVRGRND